MTETKVECITCGALILERTAARNGGLCVPCKKGTRHLIEAAHIQREKAKSDRFDALFRRIRTRATPHGFATLSHSEATFYAVCVLFSDLKRGAVQLFFNQFFFDTNDPAFQKLVTEGLVVLGRGELLVLLEEARKLCAEQDAWYLTEYSEDAVPPHEDQLSQITNKLRDASEDVFARLEHFAVEQGLL